MKSHINKALSAEAQRRKQSGREEETPSYTIGSTVFTTPVQNLALSLREEIETRPLKMPSHLEQYQNTGISLGNVEFIQSPIKLTISVLVSNSIDTIRKCMDSIKPLLDAVPSELIVVDTGGTDGSIEIAREYTQKVVSFQWCSDFSAARNAGMQVAQGEWFMFLDDDEWFEDVTEIIEFFTSGECDKYGHADYVQRNYHDLEGKTYQDFAAGRIARRTPVTRFQNIIHEYLTPIFPPCKALTSYVHHYGYIPKTPAERGEKSRRNIPLLLKQLEMTPDDCHSYLQLVNEYSALGENHKAIAVCMRAIEIPDASWNRRDMQWILARMTGLYFAAKDYPNCIDACDKILANISFFNELTLAFTYYHKMRCHDILLQHEEALESAKEYLSKAAVLNEDEDLLLSQRCMAMEQIVTKYFVLFASYVAALQCNFLGEYQEALAYLEKMQYEDFDDPERDPDGVPAPVFPLLFEVICNAKAFDSISDYYEKAKVTEKTLTSFMEAAEDAKLRRPEDQLEIIRGLAECDGNSEYIQMNRIFLTDQEDNIPAMQLAVNWFVENKIPSLGANTAVIAYAMRNDLDIRPLVELLSPDEWRQWVQAVSADEGALEVMKEYCSSHPDHCVGEKMEFFANFVQEHK